MSITAQNISKTFGNFQALRDVDLTVPTGKLVALLGPSGSGKTTLLRIIAGLEQADAGSGSIHFHDEDVAGRHVRHRQVGFVFQHYALFRHMSVFENIAFGLKVRRRRDRPKRNVIRDKVRELLKLVQLDGLADRYPSQLSGGQRQRVALARALAVDPKVLLLDEPFGALDAKVRKELRAWLRRLHDELHVTSVFVTHDQDEALEVADEIVVMNQGRIEQVGTPDEVFHHPKTEFVMRFLGEVNTFHGRRAALSATNGQNSLSESHEDSPVFVRPHEIELYSTPQETNAPALPVVVESLQSAGPQVRLQLRTENGELINAEIPHRIARLHCLEKSQKLYAVLGEFRVFRE